MIKKVSITYILVLIIFSIFSYFFVDNNLPYIKPIFSGFIFSHKIITTIIYIMIVSLFYTFYIVLIRFIHEGKITYNSVKRLVISSTVLLFFSYPAILSYDIFNYLLTAKVLVYYKENPYLIMPIEFYHEPFLIFTRAANKIALYGPVWTGLTALPFSLSFGNFFLAVLSFKLLVAFFYLALIFIMWKFTKNLFAVSLFALNPLVLTETFISGHNDIVMMFFAIFSYYLISKKKILLGFIFLMLSIGIKYATILLLPIELFLIWKTFRYKEVNWEHIFSLSFFVMLLALLFAPIREEIYPWYGVWFLVFLPFLSKRKKLLKFSFAFSFGLLLSYVPYMAFGSYSGLTPYLKTMLIFLPCLLLLLYMIFFKLLWRKGRVYLPF